MLLVLGALVALAAAGIAAYAWWDVLMPRGGLPPISRGTPTRLLDQRVPGFSLPGLVGPGFEARHLMTSRKPIVVKFWGSWSPACILEHPQLMELQAARVEMWAIVFRDSRTNALDYLERNGNPYARVALDAGGRVASDWGVSAAPSTFIVDGEGIVRWHRAGPLTQEILARELWPMLERLAA
jgi:cytochrome c biogenesis protein CcmG/thiol:disulfide interchange protein DsbE